MNEWFGDGMHRRLYGIGFALIFGGFYLSVSHAMTGKAGGTISRLIVVCITLILVARACLSIYG